MSEILTEMVSFSSVQVGAQGYLAQPADGKAHPGMIVIQEWWGLVPHIKDVAERFARQGFAALAPDLYHGQAADEPDEARKLVMELDMGRAVQEILAGAQYLRSLSQVQPKKIGVVGFCMGGGLSIAAAASGAELGAAVAFYGLPRDFDLVKKVRVPLLGIYGELDHGFTPERLHSLDEELTRNQVVHEIHIYPGAEHAFFNDARAHTYHPQAAQDAWQRTLDWFQRYLKS